MHFRPERMSKVNIHDLFATARAKEVVSVSSPLSVNTLVPLAGKGTSAFEIRDGDEELPEFFSDSSTISLLPGGSGAAAGGRLVAAGGQYLCLARGEALWVLDMTTGMSNDRSVKSNADPIVDMEFSATASLLAFTDGIDVGIIKCVGMNGDAVHLNGAVYLRGVGSVDDPVVAVRWHPVHSPAFVTVRASSGWTLWDLVRLQSKAVVADSAVVPALFRQSVDGPYTVCEGTYKWSNASMTIAGKTVSAGVLAILKRGEDSSPKPRGVSGKFSSFSFSSDGAFAFAAVGSVIKVWSVGAQCSAVAVSKSVEDSLSAVTGGKVIRAIVGLTNNRVGFVSQHELLVASLGTAAEMERSVSFSNLDLGCVTKFSFNSVKSGSREQAIVLSGKRSDGQSMIVVVFEDSIVAIHGQQESISALVAVPTVGNARQFALYANGLAANGSSMWTAQTLDTDLEGSTTQKSPVLHIASDAAEASPLVGFYDQVGETSPINDDDFPRSDTSASPPERLESTVEFNNRQDDWSEPARDLMIAEITQVVASITEQRVAEFLKDSVAKLVRSSQQQMEKEQKRIEQSVTETIRRVVKDQFGSAMKRAMTEISTQMERQIAQRFDTFSAAIAKDSKSETVERLDQLIVRVDAAIAQARAGSSIPSMGSAEPPALAEIRRYINAGDHVQAIATAAQWWKLNSGTSTQSDLLAIACAAIAPQLRAGEPLRDVVTGCYMLLVLTEWTKSNAAVHADRTVAVLRAARYVISCLFVSPVNLAGESLELCYKSLSKSVRNAAAVQGSGDRTVDDLSRDVLSEVRELMMRFSMNSRESTPRSSVAGSSILQLLQSGSRARHL